MQRIKKRAVLLAVCAALAILTGVFAFYQLHPKYELPPTDWMLTFSVGMIL